MQHGLNWLRLESIFTNLICRTEKTLNEMDLFQHLVYIEAEQPSSQLLLIHNISSTERFPQNPVIPICSKLKFGNWSILIKPSYFCFLKCICIITWLRMFKTNEANGFLTANFPFIIKLFTRCGRNKVNIKIIWSSNIRLFGVLALCDFSVSNNFDNGTFYNMTEINLLPVTFEKSQNFILHIGWTTTKCFGSNL